MCHCVQIVDQLNEIKFTQSMYPDQIIIEDNDLKACLLQQDSIDYNTTDQPSDSGEDKTLVHSHPLTFYFRIKDTIATYEIHFSLDREYPLNGKIACLVRIYEINETNKDNSSGDNQPVMQQQQRQQQQKQQVTKHQHLQANYLKKAESSINRQLSAHISGKEFVDVLGVILWVQGWFTGETRKQIEQGEGQEQENLQTNKTDNKKEEKTDDDDDDDDNEDYDDLSNELLSKDDGTNCFFPQRHNFPGNDNGTGSNKNNYTNSQNQKLFKQQQAAAHSSSPSQEKNGNNQSDSSSTNCRLWIYSHHIYSKTKRKIINEEAGYGCLAGFVRPGKPGFICVEGLEENCETFWRKIRSLNWQRISLIVKEYPLNESLYQSFEDIPMDNSSFIRYLDKHGGSHIIKDYLGLSSN